MKILIAALLFSISCFSFADEKHPEYFCETHGDCQTKYGVTTGIKYYLVKTGYNTCRLNSTIVNLGSHCEFIPNKNWGYCERELQPTPPAFDPMNPDCTNAIDPSEID